MDALLALLRNWQENIDDVKIKESDIEAVTKIYTPEFRHSYYELSEFLEKESGPDERDLLSDKVDKLLEEINDKGDSLIHVRKGLFKLADHLSLETMRLNRMENIKYLANDAKKKLIDTDDQRKEYVSKLDEVSRKINGFHGQSITILGIFAGIVLGFTSGIEVVETAINALANTNLRDAVTFTVVLGLILFNTFFMFMYMLGKISEKSVSVTCQSDNCNNCRKNCHVAIVKAWKKYPYVIMVNGILLIVLGLALFIL